MNDAPNATWTVQKPFIVGGLAIAGVFAAIIDAMPPPR